MNAINSPETSFGRALRRQLLHAHRRYLLLAAAFSAVINLLYLTPSIFMLQVYDRVVPTGGKVTLLLLGIVALGGLALLSFLDWMRARVLLKASAHIDSLLAGPVLAEVLSRRTISRVDRAQAMREIDALRSVVTGGAITALLDMPWTPIFLVTAFLLHPWLGVFTTVSAIFILALAAASERAVHRELEQANNASSTAYARQAHFAMYSNEIRALGMVAAMRATALADREEVERVSFRAGLRINGYASVAKFFRMFAQSAALAVAALLAINGSITAGVITVGTLILGRALQPIELLVGSWKSLIRAQTALEALEKIGTGRNEREYTRLPDPVGAINVERLTVATPQGDRVALSDVDFSVAPGEILSVVGHSGAGKSTLLRALVGSAKVVRGNIRIDGAQISDREPDHLGRLIGYLPQERVVFTGTVKENISRFDTTLDVVAEKIDAGVIQAAMRAGAHEMILALPQGYDTPLGNDGAGLSSGQAQRISLARACYGEPRIMVLDEPCANLDAEAKLALLKLLQANRREGVTTVLSSHDGEIVRAGDTVLLLAAGRVARIEPISSNSGQVIRQGERAAPANHGTRSPMSQQATSSNRGERPAAPEQEVATVAAPESAAGQGERRDEGRDA